MALARQIGDVEIVSVDSMQVYRGMDIGTAKPTPAEQAEVPHHVINLVDPWEEFDVHSFQAAVRAALADIVSRGSGRCWWAARPYLRAVVDDLTSPVGILPSPPHCMPNPTRPGFIGVSLLDAPGASRMEPTNRRRIIRALEVTLGSGRPFSSFGPGLEVYPPSGIDLVGIALPRTVVADRIAVRYRQQLECGFLDEVRRMAELPLPLSRSAAQALGYRELLAHRRGELGLDEAVDLAIRRTRRLANRQRVWFQRDPASSGSTRRRIPMTCCRHWSAMQSASGEGRNRRWIAVRACDTGRDGVPADQAPRPRQRLPRLARLVCRHVRRGCRHGAPVV
ncbi:MAG: tRNA (adenosine(37)-N6)-dimethylallyltransferase MiaA [Acidimicrobiales bacterium]